MLFPGLGQVQIKLGDFRSALSNFEKVLEVYPDNCETLKVSTKIESTISSPFLYSFSVCCNLSCISFDQMFFAWRNWFRFYKMSNNHCKLYDDLYLFIPSVLPSNMYFICHTYRLSSHTCLWLCAFRLLLFFCSPFSYFLPFLCSKSSASHWSPFSLFMSSNLSPLTHV